MIIDLLVTTWANALQPPVIQEARVRYYVRKRAKRKSGAFLARDTPGVAPYETNVYPETREIILMIKPVTESSEVPNDATFCNRWRILMDHISQWRCTIAK